MFKQNTKIEKLRLKIGIIIIFSVFFSLVGSGVLSATSDIYTVKQTIKTTSGSVEPPEAPQNLTATAVSVSQINLSWDASVPGDLPVFGYTIFRDGSEINTTSNTTYEDSSLATSTSYSYQVSAFDILGNDSDLSNIASATTFDEVVSDDAGSSSGGGSFFEITNLSVQPDFYKATIKIETNFSSKILFKWGKTPDYEREVIVTEDLKKIHTIILKNLEPQNKYYFEFEVFDNIGRKIKVSNQTFETLSLSINNLLLNVSDFQAGSDEEKIILSWNNPSISFDGIRIVRSNKTFPRDPFDGELIYVGKGEEYQDKDVEKGIDYYYTAFVEDQDGRFSSGAITRGRILLPDEEPIPSDLFAGIIELPPSKIGLKIKKLVLKDFEFIQDNRQALILNNNTVLVKGDRVLRVSVSYEKLPEVLKTLAVTLKDPDNPKKVFNFLLRVNQDKTAFEASIAPLGREGVFGLNVSILDHKNRGLKNLTGSLKSTLPFGLSSGPGFKILFLFFFILFSLILILRVLWKRLNLMNKHEATI